MKRKWDKKLLCLRERERERNRGRARGKIVFSIGGREKTTCQRLKFSVEKRIQIYLEK